ncbi:MAG TPA: 4-alpha-glucanotransferase [bacterium]|nr:4-alpha-glucanotransferase [bacterium]
MKTKKRLAGILLHISSLYGEDLIGVLGKAAFEFVDFLEESGQTLWQLNPIGHTGFGDSPYQCFSAFAGNPLFIDLEKYLKLGILTKKEWQDYIANNDYSKIDYGRLVFSKTKLLKLIYDRIKKSLDKYIDTKEYNKFCDEYKWWLNDYAIFMALKNYYNGAAWNKWAADIKLREQSALEKYGIKLSEEILFYKFWQFEFYQQWLKLKKYANEKNVKIIGDIPIFVAYDSADVWANKKMFMLDENGEMTFVAGVPPDYFSETGQYWGNPLYDWNYHQAIGFDWWLKRIGLSLYLFDGIRIDHFRGFEAFWTIPVAENTAVNGYWTKAPGFELFRKIKENLREPFIIAEDLGVITPEVEMLRDTYNFPGMKILQFSFSDETNPYLPHNYNTTNCVVFTGTHDNETTIGWFDSISKDEKIFEIVRQYLPNINNKNAHLKLIEYAFSSVADYAIIPLQDWLGLDNSARMNTPSTPQGNWQWRCQKKQLTKPLAKNILKLTKIYNRVNKT